MPYTNPTASRRRPHPISIGPPGPILVVAATVLVVVLTSHYSRLYFRNVVDDSLTSMQYARNLARGDGLVFNAGERVEGYTNFLWVLLMTPLYAASQLTSVRFVPIAVDASALFAAADAVLVYLIGRKLWTGNAPAMLVALGLIVADNSYTVWAAMALEGHFFAFWLLLALWLRPSTAPGRPMILGIVLACLQMTRPDGAIFSILFVADQAVEAAVTSPRRSTTRRRLLVTCVVWLGLYGAYFAWRYSYYGAALPNTYYVKLGGSSFDGWARGLAHATSFLDDRGWVPLAALLALFWCKSPTVRVAWLWLVAHTVYVIYIGGDFYPGHRFFVVAIPAMALCIGQVVFGLTEPIRARRSVLASRPLAAASVVAAAVGLGVALVCRTAVLGVERGPLRTEILRFGRKIDNDRRFMLWLAERAPAGASIMAGDIGSAGFYTDLRVVDYYGIIDPAIAMRDVTTLGRGKAGHEKMATLDHLLSQNPTFIKWGFAHADFYRHGYYLDPTVPMAYAPGIWVRDTPAEPGTVHQAVSIHFDGGDYAGWAPSGSAFSSWPTSERMVERTPVLGAVDGFVSSYDRALGDDATGRLESPPLHLVGDRMILRVGGGYDPEKLRASLVIDGERVFTATGRNTEILARHSWDIRRFHGSTGVLEIVDEKKGAWAHIMVDEVIQWSADIAASPG